MPGRGAYAISAIVIILLILGIVIIWRGGGSLTATSTSSTTSPAITPTTHEEKGFSITAATIKSGISTLDIVQASKNIQLEAGVNFTVLRLNTPPQVVDSILKGDAQIAIVPVELAGVIMEKGGDVYIIALDNEMNQAILVRANSSIKSPVDLKGRKVAAVVGSGTYAIFKALMKELYNLTVGPGPSYDIQVVNMPPPAVIDALARGDVDAAVIWEPLVSEAVIAKHLVILANFTDLWKQYAGDKPAPMLVWVATSSLVKNRDLLNAVLKAHMLAAERWDNDENWTIHFLSGFYNIDPMVAKMVWLRDYMYTGKCITSNLAEEMSRVWSLAVESGYIKEKPGIDRIITCSMLGLNKGNG